MVAKKTENFFEGIYQALIGKKKTLCMYRKTFVLAACEKMGVGDGPNPFESIQKKEPVKIDYCIITIKRAMKDKPKKAMRNILQWEKDLKKSMGI